MKQIKLTSNFNGVLNREEGTTFAHISPTYHITTPIKINEEFEIYYKDVLFGVAKVIDLINYAPKELTNTACLLLYGYPLKSFITAMQKMYINFEYEKTGLTMIVFVWQEKFLNGVKKIHSSFKYCSNRTN